MLRSACLITQCKACSSFTGCLPIKKRKRLKYILSVVLEQIVYRERSLKSTSQSFLFIALLKILMIKHISERRKGKKNFFLNQNIALNSKLSKNKNIFNASRVFYSIKNSNVSKTKMTLGFAKFMCDIFRTFEMKHIFSLSRNYRSSVHITRPLLHTSKQYLR